MAEIREAKVAAAWWAEKLRARCPDQEKKIAHFQQCVELQIQQRFAGTPRAMVLYTEDCGPRGYLAEAVAWARLTIGAFDWPYITHMYVQPGKVKVYEGYNQPPRILFDAAQR